MPMNRIIPIRWTARWCEADGWHIGYVLQCGCRVEAPERSRNEAGFQCPMGHVWPPPVYGQLVADGEVVGE